MKQNNSINSVLKFAGMVLGTGACGLVVAFGTAYSLAALLRNTQDGWGGLAGIVIGLFFFYPAGVVIGQIIFKLRHFKGSLWLGIAGVVIGVLTTIAMNFLFHINTNSNALVITLYVLTAVMGTAGYFLGRRKQGLTP